MNVYRKEPLPAIYTRLGFVRKFATYGFLADCPEDLSHLRELQSVVAGNACISSLERDYMLFVKADFPDDILTRDGSSDDVIKWGVFCWKLWDAESLVKDSRPTEAISYEDAGIDADYLDSLAHPTSCLPMLRETQKLFESANGRDKGYELNPKRAADIKEIEKQLFASIKLRAMKQGMTKRKPTTTPKSPKTSGNPQVSPKRRNEILQKNNYRCVFCGNDASDGAKLEVNHIIPRNLIKKLHLDSALHTTPENLCVTCFSCNRGKSDNLASKDIEYYCNAFSNPEHPNHGLLPYLRKISELQTLWRQVPE